jgi:DNA-binding IclR family transcriptional regulator
VSEIKALARGLRILDQLLEASRDPERAEVSVTELAERLEVNKSSASRLVRTLVDHGYLRPSGVGRGYLLGPKMRPTVPREPGGVRELARPFLYLLMKRSGECAHTAIYAQGRALIIDDVESAASLRVAGGVGRLNPLHCTAVGKSLLAFGDVPLPEALPRRTERTITDPDALVIHLEEIRRQGYALDDIENEEGVRCLAAPVYDLDERAIASIGISGPTIRMTDERLPAHAALVLEASRELSQALGSQRYGRRRSEAPP